HGIQDKGRPAHQELATHNGTLRIVCNRAAGPDQVLRRPPQLLPRLIEELLVLGPGAVLPPEREVTLEPAIQIAFHDFPVASRGADSSPEASSGLSPPASRSDWVAGARHNPPWEGRPDQNLSGQPTLDVIRNKDSSPNSAGKTDERPYF